MLQLITCQTEKICVIYEKKKNMSYDRLTVKFKVINEFSQVGQLT